MTDDSVASASGVAHAEILLDFAEAAVAGDDQTLATARSQLLEALGPEALVDAAAVVGNFQRMVRIADATGIPLDAPMQLLTEDLRAELGLDRFGSAANTPTASSGRLALGRVLKPLAFGALKLYGAVRRRSRRA